jgi:hypothetical protein
MTYSQAQNLIARTYGIGVMAAGLAVTDSADAARPAAARHRDKLAYGFQATTTAASSSDSCGTEPISSEGLTS